VTISPVKDIAGKVLGASVTARDITERKRAEELASHLASIVEASDDAIFVRSLNRAIVSWNSGADRLYGYKAEILPRRKDLGDASTRQKASSGVCLTL